MSLTERFSCAQSSGVPFGGFLICCLSSSWIFYSRFKMHHLQLAFHSWVFSNWFAVCLLENGAWKGASVILGIVHSLCNNEMVRRAYCPLFGRPRANIRSARNSDSESHHRLNFVLHFRKATKHILQYHHDRFKTHWIPSTERQRRSLSQTHQQNIELKYSKSKWDYVTNFHNILANANLISETIFSLIFFSFLIKPVSIFTQKYVARHGVVGSSSKGFASGWVLCTKMSLHALMLSS